jgi:hypothetical protein
MELLQYVDPREPADGRNRVGRVVDGEVVDLTQADGPRTVHEVYYGHGGDEVGLDEAVRRLERQAGKARRLPLDGLLAQRGPGGPHLVKPVSGPVGQPHGLRVWLAGVTHADSARLREIEAKQATGTAVNVYEQKYRECAAGGRPELFAKNDPDAVVGHGQSLTRPADTQRLVPETELVSVYALDRSGQVVCLGYTGGDDATDNGIEAANPLNLPQAKNWDGGCASLGPLLITASEFDDAEVAVSCEVLRDGRRVGYKEGMTGQRHLNMPDRLFHMERSLFSRLALPPRQLQAIYWGTPVVFAEKDLAAGLQVGDVVRMSFSGGIGVLENDIAALPETAQLRERAAAADHR